MLFITYMNIEYEYRVVFGQPEKRSLDLSDHVRIKVLKQEKSDSIKTILIWFISPNTSPVRPHLPRDPFEPISVSATTVWVSLGNYENGQRN